MVSNTNREGVRLCCARRRYGFFVAAFDTVCTPSGTTSITLAIMKQDGTAYSAPGFI